MGKDVEESSPNVQVMRRCAHSGLVRQRNSSDTSKRIIITETFFMLE
jgi:hypothetical protein